MGRKQPSAQDMRALIWVCRRLASALHEEMTLVPALDAISEHAPATSRLLLRALRQGALSRDGMARALIPQGFPAFMWGALLYGELSATVAAAATLLADRLELEQVMAPPEDPALHCYSLFFGRLAMMLQVGVPLAQALEDAAESAAVPEVREILTGVAGAVHNGGDLSEALARAASDLPPMTVQMIRDGEEEEDRLPPALSVVADYLLDEAGQEHSTKKEARNA